MRRYLSQPLYERTFNLEILRRLIRRIIGYNSRLYKAGATLLGFISVTKKDGIRMWFKLRQLRTGKLESDSPIPVVLRNLRYPILIRPKTADAVTIIDNVVREEYGHFRSSINPEWMIDAGAYIGDTAAYFLSRFPSLKVVALEPSPPSYEMAARNLRPYEERVVLLKKGLSATDQWLTFGGTSTGTSIQETGFAIECTSIPTLLKQFSISRVNILKMDIEGGEEMIFSSNPGAWLSHVDLLIIELHGSHIEALVSRTLCQNGFSIKQYRSVWYCTRNRQL